MQSCGKAHANSPEIPHSRSVRPVYSTSQVQSYLRFIELPESYRQSPVFRKAALALEEEHGLPLLTALMRFQMAKIPFENLVLHYSSYYHATLDASELFELMITSGSNRGGHCLQLNAFFGNMIRSIGFNLITSAARVNTACQAGAKDSGFLGPSYNSWDHMINVVRFSSERYLVDIGMNARGPTVPVLMRDDTHVVSMPPRTIRLIRGCIAENSWCDPSNKLWQLQVCEAPNSSWIPTYAFPDVEFIPADFEMMNWYINAHRKSWFTHKIAVGKMLLDNNGNEIVGNITLYEKTLKKRVSGRVVFELECNSEGDRMNMLQRYFGIRLSAQERECIRGTMSEIR